MVSSYPRPAQEGLKAPPRHGQETVHLVQAFVAGRGQALKAEPAVPAAHRRGPRRKAERLSPLRLGVVAFSASADTELGEYDDNPVLLFEAGRLPPPFDEL